MQNNLSWSTNINSFLVNCSAILSRSNLIRVAKSGYWAILDQALFTGSNFVLNLLLARWLIPSEFGAYAAVTAALWLIGTLHTALITEPMLVFGPTKDSENQKAYIGKLILGHIGFSLILISITTVFTLFVYSSTTWTPFIPLIMTSTIGSSCIFFLWLMRRACYACLQPRTSALGGILYLVFMTTGIYGLNFNDWLSSVSALLLLSISSLAAGSWIANRLGVSHKNQPSQLSFSQIVREHLAYGRWAVAASLLTWVPSNLYFLILPAWAGLEAGGAYQAIMNLNMPVIQTFSVISILLVPIFVQARGKPNFLYIIRASLVLLIFSSILYWVLVGSFQQSLINYAYADQYHKYAGLYWVLGIYPIISAPITILGGMLRALERPDAIFWSYLISTLLTITLGLSFVVMYGVFGAAIGLIISSVGTVTTMVFILYSQQLTFNTARI